MECCIKIFKDWHHYNCLRPATVERDGKWYCASHDPVAVETRKTKSEAKRKEKECKQCGLILENYWTYCPKCGARK